MYRASEVRAEGQWKFRLIEVTGNKNLMRVLESAGHWPHRQSAWGHIESSLLCEMQFKGMLTVHLFKMVVIWLEFCWTWK